jgi:hypothetical protein
MTNQPLAAGQQFVVAEDEGTHGGFGGGGFILVPVTVPVAPVVAAPVVAAPLIGGMFMHLHPQLCCLDYVCVHVLL